MNSSNSCAKALRDIPLRIFALICFCIITVLSSSVRADEVVLQDDQLLVAFDSDSGALTRLENKNTHWLAERRTELGLSFRLTVISPDHKDIAVAALRQHADVKKPSDHEVRFQWKNLTNQQVDVSAMAFSATVTLTNGALKFAAALENNSSLMVRSVDYPYFGDLNKAPDGGPLTTRSMWYGNLPSQVISNRVGIMSRQSIFCLVQSPKEGLYVEMNDPTQPYLLNYMFEPRGSAKSRDNPPHTEFFTSHQAYVHPNSTMKLVPVVMQFYSGDWHAGVDLYKAWRATWFKPPTLPAWIKDVHSWQQLQIGSPEQDWRVPYTNLISYAKECADNDVRAIQLVGWNNGGQDGGDPAQDPDPGLGTWQQLHDFIAQSQNMGVKIILFAKLNWADLTTAWYTNELYKYECKEEDGKRSEQGGYTYFTPTQLAGIGVHRRAVMDFQSPAYRDVATREFEKILALGSAGWLWDEVCHHANVRYSWANDHGYTPPAYIYGGDLPLARQMRAAADKVSPEFLFSGEGPEDWLLQYFPCSYFRINSDSTPVDRYIDPQAPLMVAVTGFDDREMLNFILMDRYIISYEPFNFKGYLADFPLTLAYGKKIDALRRRYREYLWDARFRDTLGAEVSSDGDSRYSVFVTTSGRRAVVVVNTGSSKTITATVKLPSPGKLLVATPEQPESKPTDGVLKIPARSVAVMMER